MLFPGGNNKKRKSPQIVKYNIRGRRETRERRREKGDGRRETGGRRWEAGGGRQEVGGRKREAGDVVRGNKWDPPTS